MEKLRIFTSSLQASYAGRWGGGLYLGVWGSGVRRVGFTLCEGGAREPEGPATSARRTYVRRRSRLGGRETLSLSGQRVHCAPCKLTYLENFPFPGL